MAISCACRTIVLEMLAHDLLCGEIIIIGVTSLNLSSNFRVHYFARMPAISDVEPIGCYRLILRGAVQPSPPFSLKCLVFYWHFLCGQLLEKLKYKSINTAVPELMIFKRLERFSRIINVNF